MQPTSSCHMAIRLGLALLIIISLRGVGLACVGPAAQVEVIAKSISHALNISMLNGKERRFLPTTAIARYTDLVQALGEYGSFLPSTEPRTEPRLSLWRRDLLSLFSRFFGSASCSSFRCPPALWSFISYEASDDGRDYTLTLRVESSIQPALVIVTPRDVDTQYGAVASSSQSSSKP